MVEAAPPRRRCGAGRWSRWRAGQALRGSQRTGRQSALATRRRSTWRRATRRTPAGLTGSDCHAGRTSSKGVRIVGEGSLQRCETAADVHWPGDLPGISRLSDASWDGFGRLSTGCSAGGASFGGRTFLHCPAALHRT
ncbi:predicted protein [Streptomyces sp. AA4]|nr:predicted protein [Streptomyces sp. AA4]